ncbi:MAG: hypothetical protein MI921_17740 [Cytophagales bacterium]|nr:hypothetical protein [Cytophagales bacterium]
MKNLRIILTIVACIITITPVCSFKTNSLVDTYGEHSTLGCVLGALEYPWMNCLTSNTGSYCTVTVGSGLQIQTGKIAYEGYNCGNPVKILRRPF